jgi:hypothetical protein
MWETKEVVAGRERSREVGEEQREFEAEGEAEGEVAGLNTSSRAARPCTQWASVLLGRAS